MAKNLWTALKDGVDAGLFEGFPVPKGNVWYVAPATGDDTSDGDSWDKAFASMTPLDSKLGNNDYICLAGVLKQQWTAPVDVFDVTLIGVANRARQATDAGVATGGGASWLAPASPTATTPLLKLREQSWRIINVQFAPVASSACVRVSRAETSTDMDASHAEFINCYFSAGGAGGIGIEDVGGCSRVLVDKCRFEGLAFAIKGISTGIAVPLGWQIKNSVFNQNTSDIGMSLSYSLIEGNRFMTAGSGATNKVISTTYVSTQGGNNTIVLNVFQNTEAQIAPGSGYTGAATDFWANYVNDQAALAVGQPA